MSETIYAMEQASEQIERYAETKAKDERRPLYKLSDKLVYLSEKLAVYH